MKAVTIMSLEDVLRVMEKDTRDVRNPEKYYFWIFGTPSETGTWGYRVEGHHLSQTFTIANGKVMAAPSFYGTNPAEIREGPRTGLRVLGAEEDLARDLAQSLDATQKKAAIFLEKAPSDIVTSNKRKAEIAGAPAGISATKLNAAQFAKLNAVLDEYIQQPARAARGAPQRPGEKSGQEHLLRVGGRPQPQRAALLPHAVRHLPDRVRQHAKRRQPRPFGLRDFSGDFGADLLQAHYDTSHKK